MAKKSEYITKQEAAEILGVTVRTIERYVEQGKLKQYERLVGRTRIVFDKQEVNDLKDQVRPSEE
jgi:excisionase family DNA binding protein